MGQYFYFCNKTKDIFNTKPLYFNNDLMYIDSLYRYSEEEIITFFKKVVETMDWDLNDEIQAVGDYGDICSYINDNLRYHRISLR